MGRFSGRLWGAFHGHRQTMKIAAAEAIWNSCKPCVSGTRDAAISFPSAGHAPTPANVAALQSVVHFLRRWSAQDRGNQV
jgi:hypothetical protein